ncbi:MAG: methyltransferase domain-containing protein [Alphaproteobacteria bacterium]|nr:methyltransferase domain-containing protein [Alphaproteobacteria bacterium]
MHATPCRFCGTPLEQSFIDLGVQPPSNSYLRASELNCSEHFHPLHAYVCTKCFLVQLEQFESPEEIFSDYAYFSSYSESWLKHAKNYCQMVSDRFGLNGQHQVIEVASNDGYLLQYFTARGIPVLGVEPAANVARVAEQKGVKTRVGFFGRATARQLVEDGYAADLLIGNNVLAHVPDLNDFVAALRMTLKPDGVITMEFPHLLRLMRDCQFDTIYHEHFSYFSLSAAERVFHAHGMRLFDVDELPTHGGSLRIYGCHLEGPHPLDTRVAELKRREEDAGLNKIGTYEGFGERVRVVKRNLLSFLISAKNEGKNVVAYGAAAKGNTLLNFCGIGPDMIDYVVDANPHKQGLYLPGTRIPIATPDKIASTRPDYVLILPWNLKHEIMEMNANVKDWGGQFVLPIPDVEIVG